MALCAHLPRAPLLAGHAIRIEHVVGAAFETFHLVNFSADIPARHPCGAADALAITEMQALIERSVIRLAGWFEPLPRGSRRQIDFASGARHRPSLCPRFVQYTVLDRFGQG